MSISKIPPRSANVKGYPNSGCNCCCNTSLNKIVADDKIWLIAPPGMAVLNPLRFPSGPIQATIPNLFVDDLSVTNQIVIANAGIQTVYTPQSIVNTGSSDFNIQADGNVNLTSINENVAIASQKDCTISGSATSNLSFNTGNLSTGGNIYWNGYKMPISFTTKIDGAFNYPNGNPTDTWVNVFSLNLGFPSQFLYTIYQVSFNMNFFNNGSLASDKQLALYWEIQDGIGNVYTGYFFNQFSPWAMWFNPSQYTNSTQYPMPICYSDVYDLTAFGAPAVNDLKLNLYWWGDQIQDYKVIGNIQFIPTNLI